MAGQGANNGAGQGAGQRYVQFTRGAASRIAKVVRQVEGGDRSQPGITFDHPMPGAVKVFRVCTFTGTWAKNSNHVVTFINGGATAQAYNLFQGLTASSTKSCAIAKDGTAWYVIAAECG